MAHYTLSHFILISVPSLHLHLAATKLASPSTSLSLFFFRFHPTLHSLHFDSSHVCNVSLQIPSTFFSLLLFMRKGLSSSEVYLLCLFSRYQHIKFILSRCTHHVLINKPSLGISPGSTSVMIEIRDQYVSFLYKETDHLDLLCARATDHILKIIFVFLC